jgi:hypothetical protein
MPKHIQKHAISQPTVCCHTLTFGWSFFSACWLFPWKMLAMIGLKFKSETLHCQTCLVLVEQASVLPLEWNLYCSKCGIDWCIVAICPNIPRSIKRPLSNWFKSLHGNPGCSGILRWRDRCLQQKIVVVTLTKRQLIHRLTRPFLFFLCCSSRTLVKIEWH